MSTKRSCFLVCTLILAAAALVPTALHAQTGILHEAGPNQGDVDFSVYFRFPPTAAQVQEIKDAINDGSKLLCQATEGQLRFGQVTLLGGDGQTVLKTNADVWVYPATEINRSSVNCSPIGEPNCRVTLLYDPDLQSSDLAVAHEFAHLIFGLGDEYQEAPVRHGPCVRTNEAGWAQAGNHNCLMQAAWHNADAISNVDFGADEFCTDKWHDLVKLEDSEYPICPDSAEVISGCARDDGEGVN